MKPRPVVGTQPLPPRTTHMPNVEKKLDGIEIALILIQPYHAGKESSSSKALAYHAKAFELEHIMYYYQ